MRQEQENSRSDLVRGVLMIVVAGIALGLAFNGLGRSGEPPRGLAWVRQAERMERLEDLAETAAADSSSVVAPDPDLVADTDAEPAAPVIPPPAARVNPGAPATGHANAPAPRTSAPAPPAPDGDGGSGAGTNAGAVSTPAAAPSLPVIPVVDHPLEVELATFKKFFDAGGATVVDARDPEEFAAGHIPGARNLPFDDLFSDPTLLERFDPEGKPIICYCSGPGCDLSMQLARSLIDAGFERVLVFEAGFPAWEGAGYPVARGAGTGGGE